MPLRQFRDELPDTETIDDLIDSLWRHGSAQDYPKPEPEYPAYLQVKTLNDHRHSRYREFTDRRSLTRDQNIDDPPVPGYRDLPAGITLDYAANHPIKGTGILKGRRRGK